jgi:hypothetical protein
MDGATSVASKVAPAIVVIASRLVIFFKIRASQAARAALAL